MQQRQAALRSGAQWMVIAALAATGAVLLFALASAGASAKGGGQLERKCIDVALRKPQIEKVGITHAGQHGPRYESAYMNVRYGAMPDACREDYFRGSHAFGQVYSHGKWIRHNAWYPPRGGKEVLDPEVNGSHSDQQVAFTGRFESEPPLADMPTRLNPCRVRIRLIQTVSHPEHHSDSGYHPPHYLATKIYSVDVPVSRISPHRGKACNLLVQ